MEIQEICYLFKNIYAIRKEIIAQNTLFQLVTIVSYKKRYLKLPLKLDLLYIDEIKIIWKEKNGDQKSFKWVIHFYQQC